METRTARRYSGSAQPLPNTTASTSRPAALRKMEPRFSWSLTPSSTATVRAPSTTSRDAALRHPPCRGEHPAVEVKADRLAPSPLPTPGSRAPHCRPNPSSSSVESAVGAQESQRRERRGQHALHDQHTLGDHQALAAGQVRPSVNAVQIPEVVQPRIVGIVDIADVAHRRRSKTFVVKGFRQPAPKSGRPPRAACRGRGLQRLQPLREPLLAGPAFGLQQFGAGFGDRNQDLPAVVGVATRSTKPRSANEAITRVIDGGRTRSLIASAPGVIGPKLANVARADSCDNDTGDCGRRNRSCRESRITASDKSLANRYRHRSQREGYDRTRSRQRESPSPGSPGYVDGPAPPRPHAPASSPGYLDSDVRRTW